MSLGIPDGTVLIALTTVGTADEAARLAERLIADRVAACVNVIPNVLSTYHWKGATERAAPELLLVIKTTQGRYADLEQSLRTHHPYEVPELVAIPASAVFLPYAQWVRNSVAPR